jgi:hypothetical protein
MLRKKERNATTTIKKIRRDGGKEEGRKRNVDKQNRTRWVQ